MDILSSITKVVSLTFNIFFNQLKSVNNLMVKSNDENLEQLLESPEDKAKFQRAVDEISKKSTSTEVILNGRNVTISI